MSAEVPTPTDAPAPAPGFVPACNYCRKGHTACDVYAPPVFTSYFSSGTFIQYKYIYIRHFLNPK